ncbi:protection of telomeres protein 1b isoform X2 [Morus notabilis]|uniref:protection of telomeres protein 1b isoform X2 n=1 Tax=Morus notabilis TaxID=981085 RepID=UPI000CED2336|nr:protection of telomeres protein 1b isoform X2 [Morus notabilis]
MGERDDYKFLEIRDAIASINQKVSLIGVIIECGFPKKTKGTDCFCTLKIVDQSYQKPGLSVHVFAEHFGALPHVAALGDIVQLSHVMMKTHGGEVYAVFNKRSSAFALYEGRDGEGFLPYQKYPKFQPGDLDKKFIMSLRKWVVDFQTVEDSKNFSLLRELKEGKSVNLACKVINVQEFGKDEWIGFLWDGTDSRPNSLPIRLEDEKDNPLPLHLESLPLPRDKLDSFPVVGTILRVVFDQRIKKHGLQLLNANVGEWMKFIDVHCEVRAGLWRGVLTPLTKVRYTPNKDHIVSERQSIYERRLHKRNGRIPYWSFPWMSHITEIDYKDVPFVTLMDVLTYPEVTAKFMCAVRVVAAYPWQGKDFCCSRGIYRVRLTLEDPTGRIHAYLYGEDGVMVSGK